MKKVDTSVVISCSNDIRVFDCIKSIDHPVEIIVVITPNKEIEDKLAKMKIKYVYSPRGNEGLKNNRGIETCSNDKIILVDSDCVFAKGAIEKLIQGLKKHGVCKGRVVYLNDGSLVSKLISKARDHINSNENLAYTPGLALNRQAVVAKMGRLFREDLLWAADSEFSFRMHKSGLAFGYIKGAKLCHPPVSVKHDLKGAFLIGVGKRRAVDVGAREGDEDILPTLMRLVKGELIRKRLDMLKKKGLGTLAYMSIWDVAYNLGYNLRRLKCSQRIENSIWQTFGQK